MEKPDKKPDKKSVVFWAITAALTAALCIALALVIFFSLDNTFKGPEKLPVERDETGSKTVDVSFDTLVPGSSVILPFTFDAPFSTAAHMDLHFVSDGADSLAPYVTATVTLNGETVADTDLHSLMSDTPSSFSFDLQAGVDCPLVFCFTLPETVGNEAQNKVCDFKIEMTWGCGYE